MINNTIGLADYSMPRILRAIFISAVATSTAVALTAILKRREDPQSPKRLHPESKHPTYRREIPEPSDPIRSLSAEEEEMLLNELKDHV
ncbi:MAG: hypothetical protein HKN13_05680 [Rhodothermales bacterium]|nr:hypothetical protein [Rhodothermales bacterium]